MGCFAPPKVGELVRLVLELKGTTGAKQLSQREYLAYKAAVKKIADKYGAKIASRERVIAFPPTCKAPQLRRRK